MAPLQKVVNHVEGLFKECARMEKKFGANGFHSTTASYHIFSGDKHTDTADAIVASINNIMPGRVTVIDGSKATQKAFVDDLARANRLKPSVFIVKHLEEFSAEHAVADRVAGLKAASFLSAIDSLYLPHNGACIVGFVDRLADLNTLARNSPHLVLEL